MISHSSVLLMCIVRDWRWQMGWWQIVMLAMGEFQVKSEETARSPEKCDLVGVDADDVISVAVMPVADPPAFPRLRCGHHPLGGRTRSYLVTLMEWRLCVGNNIPFYRLGAYSCC